MLVKLAEPCGLVAGEPWQTAYLNLQSFRCKYLLESPTPQCHRRAARGAATIAFRDKPPLNALMCEHALLPVLSRDSASDEILGWECVFCDEYFAEYPTIRETEEALARALEALEMIASLSPQQRTT